MLDFSRFTPWRARGVLVALLTGSALLFVAGASSASSYTIGSPVLASGPSPFAACTIGGTPGETNTLNSEVEPFVAVNPTDASNIIGVYQQDRWAGGGAHGLVASRSSNGGLTWSQNFAHFDACSGGTGTGAYDRASDPWVTFDPNGNAYQISLSFSADNITSAVLVSKSTDGGATWGLPKTLIRDTSIVNFNDKESITADPTRPGTVYAVWDRFAIPGENRSFNSLLHSAAFRGQPVFSRTTDGGNTWSAPVPMTNQDVATIGNQIAVLPNGNLIDVFFASKGSGKQPSPNQIFEGAMISKDAGLSWTPPTTIANFVPVVGCPPEDVCDPDTNQPVRAGTNLPGVAVDRSTGAIYVVWADGRFSAGTKTDVVLSKSTDGGKTWSTPIKLDQGSGTSQAFTPAVAVAANGAVGVSFYDFRNNTAAAGVPTDAWLETSQNGGATWAEDRLTPTSFNMEAAPISRGFFLGDYEGLTAIGNDFLAFFAIANGASPTNPTDIFAVRASAP
jgi:hypothetical protein